MDIGDCNSDFLISFSEDNPCRLTHFLLILSQTAIRLYCVQLNQYRQGIDWMRETQEQPQITQYGQHQRLYCFHPGKNKEWYGTIPENLRNVPQKCRSWSSTSFNSADKIYIAHTLLIAQIQIQRKYPLLIRGFSNWAFFTSLTERQNKQSYAQWHAQQWQQDSVTN